MKGQMAQSVFSIIMILIGVELMIYMITVESEPGAIPLLLITLGMGWFFATIHRTKAHHK